MEKKNRPIELFGLSLREYIVFLLNIPRFWKLLKRYPHLRINAHNHTYFSDGGNLFALLLWNWVCGFREVWITDHNVILDERSSWNRLLIWFFKFILDVKIVAGVEISCREDLLRFGGRKNHVVHFIVGKFQRDPKSLRERLERFQIEREKRVESVVEEIRKGGFEIASYADLKKKYKNVTLEIIAKNVRYKKDGDLGSKFVEENYLKSGGRHYVSNDYLLTIEEAVSLAEEAGADTILPHPWFTMGDEVFEYYFEDIALLFKSYRTQKIESHTKKTTPKNMQRIERFCFHSGMGISGGADMHTIRDLYIYIAKMLEVYANTRKT